MDNRAQMLTAVKKLSKLKQNSVLVSVNLKCELFRMFLLY